MQNSRSTKRYYLSIPFSHPLKKFEIRPLALKFSMQKKHNCHVRKKNHLPVHRVHNLGNVMQLHKGNQTGRNAVLQPGKC